MNLPHNMTSIEDTRSMGLAGLAFLGETQEEPVQVFNLNGNTVSIYADGSVWQSANISEVWPSVGDYLGDWDNLGSPLALQIQEWADGEMTFDRFWNNYDVTKLWIATVGMPTGVQLQHNVNTDCEDYCDLGELIAEEQFYWIHELKGTIRGGKWRWNGEGDPCYLTNSVTGLTAE